MDLSDLIGPRKPPNIGISPKKYRETYIKSPSEDEVSKFSENPRNAYGKWYEHDI
jgi:hypothetical protein